MDLTSGRKQGKGSVIASTRGAAHHKVAPATRFAVLMVLIFSLAASGALAEEKAPEQTIPVVNVAVQGTTILEPQVVLDALVNTKPGNTVTESQIKDDLKAIAGTGLFYDVSAHLREVPGGAEVVLEVVENPVVTDIKIEGLTVIDPDEVRAFIRQKQGDILNSKQLTEDVRALPDAIYKKLRVPVRPLDLSVSKDGVVTVVLAETRVAEIKIEGNQKTRDNVIRREIKLAEGDVLQMDKLDASLRNILMLGFFDEVSAKFADTDDPDKNIVTIVVKERKTGTASFGAGYSSADGFIGYVDISERNFLGRGQRVNLRWEFGKNKNTYDLGFYEPYLTSDRLSLGFDIYNRSNNRSKTEDGQKIQYNEHRLGGDLTLGKQFTDFTRGSLTLKIENTKITPLDPESGMEEEEGKTRSITLSTFTDTSDHPFFPSAGHRMRLSVETAGGILGGDYEFTKYQGEYSKYLKAGNSGQTWALRLNAGAAGSGLPLQEEFRVGGADTVRGYDYGSMRGNKMFVANAEYRFKIAKSVQGVAFVDTGAAWKEEDKVELGDLKTGYGLGIRIDTPLGVMRIDYGIGSEGGQAYFSLGQSF